MDKIIPYGKQQVTQEDVEIVSRVMQEDYITTGPRVQEFETAFAEFVGANYAVAVANGTAALHLCTLALDIKPGDKVITTPITFSATANCVRYFGGDVVLCDIDPTTHLLSVEQVEDQLKNDKDHKIKGIIPVDFAGLPVNLEAFKKLADYYDLWIIEDACHAPGGYFIDSGGNKQMCGNGVHAELAIFSFHPVKHITTGEGGMVTTNNSQLFEKVKRFRNHGLIRDQQLMDEHGGWYYQLDELGYNYRLTDIQAALGNNQLKRLDDNLAKRNALAIRYDAAFSGRNIRIAPRIDGTFHAFHLYVVRVDDRKGLYNFLRKHHIYSQVHYIPLHYLHHYQHSGYNRGDFPNAEKYYDECLSLPLYPSLSDEEQDYVIQKVLEFTD